MCIIHSLRITFHANAFSELSRGSRTSWSFYLKDPLVIRRRKETLPPRTISRTTSGMP